MKRLLALIMGLTLTFNVASPANAILPLKLRLVTTSAQITPDPDGKPTTEITVIVSGSKKAKLSVRVIDLVLQKSGKSPVPAGSTNYSLKNKLKFEPEFFDYVPSSSPQRFTFRVSAINNSPKEVRYGGVQSVLSTRADDTKSSSEIAAITTFAIVPKGLSIGLGNESLKSAEISELRLEQKTKNSLADWIIPDIPGIVNQGPVSLKVKILNKNRLPIFNSQKITWSNRVETLQIQSLPQRLMFANQKINLTLDSTAPVSNSGVQKNFAKPFQELRVKFSMLTFLGSQRLNPLTREVSIIIFPWKELLFWTLILGLLVMQLVRVRNRVASDKDPNIVWLFIVWIQKLVIRKLKTIRRS